MLAGLRRPVRSLGRTPGFAAVVVVTLALGIGINTSMFSVINELLLRPLEFPEPQNLYVLQRTTAEQNGAHSPAAAGEIRRGSADFAQLAEYRNWGYTLSDPPRRPEIVHSYRVSADFFKILGLKPDLGRLFLPEEDQSGRNDVVVLSHEFWVSRFGGDPAVIGRTIRLDRRPVQIVGVLPATAALARVFRANDLYRPLGLTADEETYWTDHGYFLIGRYGAGSSAAETRARFTSLAARLAADHPKEMGGSGLRIDSLQSSHLGDTSRHITVMLLSLSGFVLLIACANLANLFLVRAMSHAREFAVRAALGASPAQLIRPVALECALLALAGGGLGVLVSLWSSRWAADWLGNGRVPLDVKLDWRVLAFACGASLLTAVFVGTVPAWAVSRVRINETLKGSSYGSTGARSQQRLRQILIVGQFSLALVLLAGAAFFVRGVDQLVHRSAGWNPSPVLGGMVRLPGGTYGNADRMMVFFTQLERRLAALPGVESAAISYELPVFGFSAQRSYNVDGRAPAAMGHEPVASVNGITPDYFTTLGTRLLRGRVFVASDRLDSPGVVIINEAMAAALFPHEDPVGCRLLPVGDQDPRPLEIVGVVENVRTVDIAPSPVRFQLYKPLAQEPWGYVAVTLRASGAAAGLLEPFRRTVAALDPEIVVEDLRPLPVSIERNTAGPTLIGRMLAGFAALGLGLAALGIYSFMARLIAQRTREIGIRMALGAQMRDVIRLVLGAGLRMALAGCCLGLLGAFALTRLLATALPGLATSAIAEIAGAAVALLAISLLACWLPVRRATRIDPMTALRAE
jgi:predicted permease